MNWRLLHATQPSLHPILALTLPNLPTDQVHTYANWCCSPAYSSLLPALALVLTNGSYSITGQFSKFPYQALTLQWISCLLVGATAKSDMASLQSWHPWGDIVT